MTGESGREVRRIAAAQGLGEAHEEPLEEVARWIARRFQVVTEHANDVISIHDAEGRIEYVSPAASGVLGRAPEELVGSLAFEVAHPDDREQLRKALSRMVEGEDVPDRVFRGGGLEKETQWLEVSGRIVEHDGRLRLIATTET